MPKSERILLWSVAAASLVLRALAFFRYRFDADEQHHAHVAWAWTVGLVQYRDSFDNHAPLFHLLTAPLVALVGERRDILLWLRIPMLLLFAVVIWGTYVIARKLYDERTALWAAVLLSLFPPFFLKSLEYRTDNLWTALWIVALLLLMQQRMFLFGLVLGCAMATSLKTMLLVVTIAAAALIAARFAKWVPARGWWKAVAGFAIVPAALAIFFAAAGGWNELVYCTLTFNGNVALTRKNVWIGRTIFPFAAAGLLYCAWRWRATKHPWRYFFAVAMGVFTVTLSGFWILISPRDFLPLMPLAAMFAAASMTRTRSFAFVALALLVSLWYYADRFESRTAWHTTMMDQVLRLSKPGEMVIDLKGETIFRRRPYYNVFENITRAQIAHGLIRDTVPEDVIRTRTHVAQADGPMWPPRARAFLSDNFVDLGRLRASGQWIGADGRFTIAVPGEYVVLNERGEARGMLDGTPHAGARELGAGAHRFERAVPNDKIVVVWAPAVRRGHSPFRLRDREF